MAESTFGGGSPSPLARFTRDAADIYTQRGDTDPDQLLGDERGLAWAAELTAELERRAPLIMELRQYFDGVQPIKFSTEAWEDAYGKEFGVITDNFCRVVVEAVVEKQVVLGFRFGTENSTDDDAWGDWQRNRLDLDSETVHTDASVTGYGYAMVWPGLDGKTEITHEDPLHTIAELDPANRRRRIAGMKRWRRRDGQWEAIVYTPDAWWRIQTDKAGSGWSVLASGENDLNVVPIVPFINSPDANGNGTSDLLPVLPQQDAINKLSADEMIVSEHAGYPQRVLFGIEEPQADEFDDDEDGDTPTVRREPEFRGGKNRWMGFEGAEARIQELAVADLSNFGKSITQKISHISSKTRTPSYLFPGGLVNISAETLRAANSGHVSRVKRRNVRFGEAWEEVMRLNFKLQGDDRAFDTSAQTVWADPETMAEGALVDALVKLRAGLDMPLEYLWGRVDDLTPEDLERIKSMREDEIQSEGARYGISGPSGVPPEPPYGADPALIPAA